MVQVYDLIFYEILKIDPASPVLNGDLFHDLIFGVLIPSVFLILFFEEFTRRVFNGKMRHLITVCGMGVLIAYGWYGVIVSMTSILFPLLLGLYLIFFFYRSIVGKKGSEAMIKGAEFLGKKSFEKILKSVKWNDEMKYEIVNNLRALKDLYVEERDLRKAYAEATSDVDRRLFHDDIVRVLNEEREVEEYLGAVIHKFGEKAKKFIKSELDDMQNNATQKERDAIKRIRMNLRIN